MQFYLFRHCEKNRLESIDPSLSHRGQDKAKNLVTLVQQGKLPVPTLLFSSPKKRAQQSLQPLSQSFSLHIEALSHLDERHGDETIKSFEKRITDFLRHLEALPQSSVVFAVSHYDWIEGALAFAPTVDNNLDVLTFSSGSYAHFSIEDSLWTLTSKGQL